MDRGEVWWAELDAPRGSAPGYPRPVVVVQADWLNRSPFGSVLVTPMTTNLERATLPGNVLVGVRGTGLAAPSVAVAPHTIAVSRRMLMKRLGRLSKDTQRKLDEALGLVLGLDEQEAQHGS